jgi:enoyl-[acyl-carrier protein] reductase II
VGDISTLPLVPQVADAVEIPVIAAGGFGDGRGLIAALSLGAMGVQMGTRFICTQECLAHENYKKRIVRANDRSTVVTGHKLGHPIRAIKNPMTTRFAQMEREDVSEDELIELGTGGLRKAFTQGDLEEGSIMAGQICGMVDDIPTASELVQRIVAEADEVLAQLQTLQVC